MSINTEKFKKDLKKLIDHGHELQLAMFIYINGEKSDEKLRNQGISNEEIKKSRKLSDNFKVYYQSWYTECLSFIKQVIPDRLDDFKSQYEIPKNRKDISSLNYVMSDFLIGLKTSRAGETLADLESALPKFQNQLAIVSAASRRFNSSLFEIRQLVQADLFDTELESARHLLKNKFLRAAGAIAGVVLEKHLAQVCQDHNIKITKKNPGISDLNEALKSAAAIEIPQWRHITLMGDYRNLCDHSKQKEPTLEQVTDLIDGTDKILKTIA